MTTTDHHIEFPPSAAGSGNAATMSFQERQKVTAQADPARVDLLATAVLTAVHDIVRRHEVSYAEYDALKAWMIQVGEDGEWPLFLDVWVEHAVEEVANAAREGSKGSIEGPYYVPGAPSLGAEGALPMREDEQGTPLLFHGLVRNVGGDPLPGATVDIWHADNDGYYAQFAPGIPEWNLRGVFITGPDGSFSIRTIQPAPYQIPTDGSCGALIRAAGWHAWRPAHLHLKVSAPGHLPVTTQLYFAGGEHVNSDIAQATKPELILSPVAVDSGAEVRYDFVLDPQ
ncbi:catechol 1,2-dioxygenase [Kineosporia sp. NBRC 101731]|uniref:catechol 1,2-dioxygenase n=1 Tax=Kineosporia sp. NBRC 101731 TaxID=3032199 RepID=UPI0024A00EBE|nr:catechol 1,2-dioxygenase [Kineosporia sp. NBRC 101731]GLY29711.1 catechol 1,2-dioxygenase [Kineosporia sp. NBRC 101731]